MLKKFRPYAFFIAAALLVGSVSALLTADNMAVYQTIERPSLAPPAVVFPIVWTILYILMGVSAAMVFNQNDSKWNAGLSFWVAQLIVNFFWSLIFFNMRNFVFAFIWLILLLVLVVIMTVLFSRTSKTAALLQIPYILWLCFAGYLNFAIIQLNG